MRIKAKDPQLISLMGEFMRFYLPHVKKRDEDMIASYRYSINLFVTYLKSEDQISVMTMQSSDFNQKNIVDFMSWLKSVRKNVAPTINHRLSLKLLDIRKTADGEADVHFYGKGQKHRITLLSKEIWRQFNR